MNRDELWNQVRQGVLDGIQYTVQKTEELTKIGRIKLEIASQKRRIGRRVADLGARVYDLLCDGAECVVREDERVRELVEQLKLDEVRLDQLNTELEALRAQPDSEAEFTIDLVDIEDDLYKTSRDKPASGEESDKTDKV
jgi:hypothetical protein